MNLCGRGYTFCRQSAPVLVGLCVGITLSLIFIPFSIDEECYLRHGHGRAIHLSSQSRSLRSQVKSTTIGDFDPLIKKLRSKPKTKTRDLAKVVRPRHYSAELGLKEKVLVAVISTKDTIVNFGLTINATLSHHVDKIVYFVDTSDPKKIPKSLPAMTVIGFPGDRPILKPFHILRYLGEYYSKDFDFFFFIPDTTFVRGLALKELVNHISVSQSVYMGQPVEEANALFCTLSSGILISRTAILPILRQLDWCTRNAFSDSINDNLGRCVLHSINLPCKEEIQGQTYRSFNFLKNVASKKNIHSLLESEYFSKVLTVSSIKDPKTMYELQRIFSELEVNEKQQAIGEIESKMEQIKNKIPSGSQNPGWPLGSYCPFKPKNRFDVIQWQYFTSGEVYLDSEFVNSHRLVGNDLEDVLLIINATATNVRKRYGRRYQFRKILNGYRRFDPTRGMEYLIDATFEESRTGVEVCKRLEIVRPLGKVEMISVPFVTENTRVTILLRVDVNNLGDASRFLENYAKVCLESQDNSVLTVVFVYEPRTTGKSDNKKNDIFARTKKLINSYATKYRNRGAKLSWISINTPGLKPSEFGILDLIVRKFRDDTLLLLCQPGMDIKAEFLNRVRMNTIRGFQVFAPIPFVQFHPDIVYKKKPDSPSPGLEVNKNYGRFDSHNYEHISFYTSDYFAGRKLIESTVPIVKLEKDLKNVKHRQLPFGLYHMFVKSGTLHVLRAVEPALLTRFKLKSCVSSVTEESHQSCMSSRLQALATRSQLADLIFSYVKKRGTDEPQTFLELNQLSDKLVGRR